MGSINMSFIESSFNSSLIENDDIDLNYYIQAYQELYKLCTLLGTIFGFVGSEILSKISVLKELKKSDKHDHFKTLKTMVSYERTNNLLHTSGYVSGSRTLLRLHRGLAFLYSFLSKVNALEMLDSTVHAGREAYDSSLARYHSWFVRSGAYVAMYALPTKQVLLQRVCKDDSNQCVRSLPSMLVSLETVYNRVQSYYEDEGLLDLP